MSTTLTPSKLLTSSSLVVFMTVVALTAGSRAARADQICTANGSVSPNIVDCADIDAPADGAARVSFTDPGYFVPAGYGRIAIMSGADLSVNFESGTVFSTPDSYAVYVFTYGGALDYTSSGTAISGQFNTTLIGNSVTATTGNLQASGASAFGLLTVSNVGNNVTTGGITQVDGDRARGIFSSAVNGNNTLNTGTVTVTGYGTKGVVANAIADVSCGHNVVNVTGNVSADFYGVQARSCSDGTINVLAGNTVSNSAPDYFAAILNDAVTNSIITVDGTVEAASAHDLAFDIYAASSHTSIGTTGHVIGTFSGTDGTDTFAISPGGVWTIDGSSDFRGGDDTLVNEGTIEAGPDAAFLNLETFDNRGTLTLPSGQGTLSAASAGLVANSYPAATILSFSALANSGSIDLRNGQAGDSITLTGDYAGGAGAALFLDAAGGAADRFTIEGSATGVTRIVVQGIDRVITNPLLVVDAFESDPNAFVLNGSATPLIDASLHQVGAQYFLTATPSAQAYLPLVAGQLARDNWYRSTDEASASLFGERTGRQVALWGQLYAARERYGSERTISAFGSDVEIDGRVRQRAQGAQAGLTYHSSRAAFALALTGGYENARSEEPTVAGNVKARGFNAGVGAEIGREAGPYAQALIKHDRSNLEFNSSGFEDVGNHPSASTTGADLRVGTRWSAGSAKADIAIGIAGTSTHVDKFTASGISYRFDDWTNARAQIGGRLEFKGKLRPFVAAKLLHEFAGGNQLTLSSGDDLDTTHAVGRGSWARLEAGLSASGVGTAPILRAWINVGDVRGAGLSAGLRF